jgi:hypothetical protein
MAIRPESRDEQAWEIFLTLLANRKPDENPLQLAQDAYRAADAFEQIRYQQREPPSRSVDPAAERRGF